MEQRAAEERGREKSVEAGALSLRAAESLVAVGADEHDSEAGGRRGAASRPDRGGPSQAHGRDATRDYSEGNRGGNVHI